MKGILLAILLGAVAIVGGASIYNNTGKQDVKVIRSIFDEVLVNGECYHNLEYLCKNIGGRLSGSPQAAAAVEWSRQVLTKMDLDTVFLQETMVPHWVRGEKEFGQIISSWAGNIEVPICALGASVGTPEVGLTAKVIETEHIEDIEKMNPADVKGKIIFLNHPFDQKHIDTFHAYGECVGGRYSGAAKAAQLGAVGVILRSLASSTDDYPHTGSMGYEEGVKKIPSAAISTKGADLLHNLLQQDPDLRFHMKMSCEQRPDALSHNVIAEIRGSEKPDEIIVVGGHLDAWDNGEGAHDDGSGVVQSMEVLRLFKEMDLKPKRTIRCVLFMNEENGQRGAITYAAEAKRKGENHLIAIESDRGGFAPRGFKVDAEDSTVLENKYQYMSAWKALLEPYGVYHVEKGFSGVDIKHLKDQGTICIGFFPDPQRYFDYHHSPNDTFDKVNERELELGAGSIASLVYLLSEYGLEGERRD